MHRTYPSNWPQVAVYSAMGEDHGEPCKEMALEGIALVGKAARID